MVLSIGVNKAYCQLLTTPKTYMKSIKLLTPVVDFGTRDVTQSYVAMILLENITDKVITLTEIKKDCSCFELQHEQKSLYPNKNFNIDVVINKPTLGYFEKKVFIHFKGIKGSIPVIIKGNFIDKKL